MMSLSSFLLFICENKPQSAAFHKSSLIHFFLVIPQSNPPPPPKVYLFYVQSFAVFVSSEICVTFWRDI